MIFEKRIQYIRRYRQIAIAFSKTGFGFIVEELGLDEMVSLPKRILLRQGKNELEEKSRGERIRLFLEEMGPTFIKLGQIASTRPDLIPADIIKELEQLQNNVPAFAYEDAIAIIEISLGVTKEEIFEHIDEKPLGSASIGQVHKGRLQSGETVAIKVQRPDIEQTVRNDLEILHRLASLAETRMSWARQYQIKDMIDEFSRAILEELDYTIEGRNTERLDKQFTEDETVYIPKVFWEATTKNVLVMEYIEGIRINDFEAIESLGYSRTTLAERLTNAVFHQILIEGFFHGDPHPGNINVLSGETIAFMDFGMVGKMTKEMKANFGALLISMMKKDADGVVRAIAHMGVVPEDVDMKQLTKDAELLRDKYYDIPLSHMNLGEAIQDIFGIANKHRIKLPADFTILGKTILTLESTVSKLDPEFSIVDVAEPFGKQLLQERYNPKNVAGRAMDQWNAFSDDISSASSNLYEFTKALKKRQVPVEVELKRSEQYMRRLDQIGNRLSFSIVLLSFSIIMVGLIIGSAMSGETNIFWNIPVIEIGFSLAVLLFMGMLYAIFKSGRF
ncbi:ABC1 kinase family protein [Salinicoccus sp. HZC-1]|uniref:ABC1 kinase family protein n=1 Tax=Salinicoccus sp. HZC-1 TaxID=3385497 RepID=UPI00398B89AF